MSMRQDARIYIAGHKGMVGSALVRLLTHLGYSDLLLASRAELDLTDQQRVNQFFATHHPDYVFFAAAKVGGIHANNTHPAEFIYQNLMMQCNVINAAYKHKVKRLLFLGSSCIYPKNATQPISEECLLTGHLEPTNEPYAIAKIAGIKMCESYNRQYGTDFRSVMPTNLYGQGDNFHPENSHVLPALIRRFHEAKTNKAPEVVVWGSGVPKREFLHVDDLAAACVHIMNADKHSIEQITQPMCSHINIGFGEDTSIADLAKLVANIIDYKGRIVFDRSRPDGTMRKLLDSSRLQQLGWQPKVFLKQGIESTYQWFLQSHEMRQ